MNEWAEYFLRLTIIWSVLLAYYRLALRFTPFAWQRFYLWSALALGLLIPLLPTWYPGAANPVLVPFGGMISVIDPAIDPIIDPTVRQSWHPDWWRWAYLIVTGGLFARTLVQSKWIIACLRTGRRARYEGIKVIHHPNVRAPFAGYGRIFLPDGGLAPDLLRTALLHETAHLRLRHHYDVLLLRLLTVLLWFHPLVYVFRRLLEHVHEYQADEAVVQNVPRKTYGLQLLRASQMAGSLGLYSSPLKNRITMLTRNATNRFSYLHALVATLLVAALSLTCSEVAVAQTPEPNEVESVSAGGVPRLATLPEGETREEAEHAFLQLVYRSIKYPAAARNAGVEGLIYLTFSVEPDGKIKQFEISRRTGPQFGDPNVVIVGYQSADSPSGDGSVKDLQDEIFRLVGVLNQTGFVYETSGYGDVPLTYGLSFQFKLE